MGVETTFLMVVGASVVVGIIGTMFVLLSRTIDGIVDKAFKEAIKDLGGFSIYG